MLVLRPNCECCDKDLPPQSTEAVICSFECTFCAHCASTVLNATCPNCAGNFVPRPIRPAAALVNNPASTERVLKAHRRVGKAAEQSITEANITGPSITEPNIIEEGIVEHTVAFYLRYVIDPNKLVEFEHYAKLWIPLVNQFGGNHLGYFLPSEGANNIALAIFSFPSLGAYEIYRCKAAKDNRCIAAFEYAQATRCIVSYERSFLLPVFS